MTVLVRSYDDGKHRDLMDRRFETREEAAEFIASEIADDRASDHNGWTYRAFETVERELTIEEKIVLS